jgi:hypothetical protein
MDGTVTCSVCGRSHSRAESELIFRRPDAVHVLSVEEREKRCQLTADIAILDEERFFLRGLLSVPVIGRSRYYNMGVWGEVSEQAFARVYELWTDPNQASEPRISASLANCLPLIKNTLGLGLQIQLTGPKTRPQFYVTDTDHPLYREQTSGIDEHRALEYTDSPSHKAAV